MGRRRKALDANRTVTVTILARHAYNIAAYAEKARMNHFRECGEDGSPALKEILTTSSNEWGRTAEAFAVAYRASLDEEVPRG